MTTPQSDPIQKPLPEFDGKHCPYCGDDGGYQLTFADRLTTWYAWDGEIQSTEGDKPVFTLKLRCISCRHIVQDVVDNAIERGLIIERDRRFGR